MVKGDITTIFSVAIFKSGLGHNGSKAKRLSPCHRVQSLAIIPYVSMVVPRFLNEHPKGIPFLFICKKKNGI